MLSIVLWEVAFIFMSTLVCISFFKYDISSYSVILTYSKGYFVFINNLFYSASKQLLSGVKGGYSNFSSVYIDALNNY